MMQTDIPLSLQADQTPFSSAFTCMSGTPAPPKLWFPSLVSLQFVSISFVLEVQN